MIIMKFMIIMTALSGMVMLSQAVIDSWKYFRVGFVDTKIASNFDTYDGLSKLSCILKCAELNCKLVGWGEKFWNDTECRVMLGTTIPLGTTVTFTTIITRLAIYAPLEGNTLEYVQPSTGLFIKMSSAASWSNARSNCRAQGLGMYTPPSLQELRDHLAIYGPFWTGTSDTDTEGSYLNEEGVSVPPNNGMYCNNEPNNSGGSEDCIQAYKTPGCLNDKNCGFSMKYFCQIGV